MKMLMTSVVLLSNCLVRPRITKLHQQFPTGQKNRKYEGLKVENKTDDKHELQTLASFSPLLWVVTPLVVISLVDLTHTGSHLTHLERLLTRKVFLEETVGVILEVEEEEV